jgi:hypothetical protein
MEFGIGMMFENRAYRAFSKALREDRLSPKLDQLKEIFRPVKLEDEKFDNILVSFVDPFPEDHYHVVRNRDRIYHVEIAVPEMPSYKPTEDEALLLKIAEKLREVLERAPVTEATREELLQRFSKWESSIRQQSMRAV